MIPDTKSLVATVGLVTVVLSEWPLGDESPAYLAILGGLALLILVLTVRTDLRDTRAAGVAVGGLATLLGGFHLAFGRGLPDVAFGGVIAGFGLLVLANKLGLAPWSDEDPVV
ncbi:hypothetical protein [Halorarum halobium]|uniref:hypothetical protein n=1 Tax=Halorarum halobium TaxID=3075121 RepID=UPI0028B1D424|nr:hypothetical protein [Halobaculum sp. XH14]